MKSTLNLEYFEKKDQSHSLSITEINNLSYETDLFFQNTLNLTLNFIKAIKNPEKVFGFRDICVWTCCVKFSRF